MSLALFLSEVVPVRPKLYRFAYRLLGNEEDAMDVVQDALMKVWQQQERMTELQNLEAWCMRIVRNLALDRLKSKKYRRSEELERAGDVPAMQQQNPYAAAEQQDVMKRVHSIIASLPEKYRTIIQLRDIDGYSYLEIADILAIEMADVKINLHRARKSVREQLQKVQVYGVQ
ncbi:RNA polymerase sigma factor [Chitinophaga tropicalis]|uniref:Sigma-70 family RNA polymerase sigma factor n=1 Tax=Chitinophaga tropicalis TaxID=2683588 RepID=A0A7K1U2S4_9BACT|nr:RNA polymerase sigma factor [Chitinophaga tropicalis]MVT08648.1 sigma-70 family RNA polymerase sigma factor [Chitinophaga tropicalis]